MKHQCDCGQIVEAEGDNLLVATCINCGSYYLYRHEIREPKKVEEVIGESTDEPIEKPKPRPAVRR